MSDLFNLNHLTKSETKTKKITQNILEGVYTSFPNIIDVFFKLPYFFGELEHPDTDRGLYQSVCATHYFQAPYTFWTLYNLYEQGYYLEATILYRHLIEAFIQIKYFDKYSKKLIKQIKRKNFKVMFDEFAPGYYENYYNILCDAAHGGLFKDFCRFERKSTSVARTRMGCEFNAFIATFLINQSIALLFGYLNIFDKIYPKNTLKSEPTVHSTLNEAKGWLVSAMESHKKEYPKTLNWYKHMGKIIY